MPNLAKEDTAFGMNGIDDGFPCFHLLFRPYARRVGVPSGWDGMRMSRVIWRWRWKWKRTRI